ITDPCKATIQNHLTRGQKALSHSKAENRTTSNSSDLPKLLVPARDCTTGVEDPSCCSGHIPVLNQAKRPLTECLPPSSVTHKAPDVACQSLCVPDREDVAVLGRYDNVAGTPHFV